MKIVWDERKRHINLLKHGLDFERLLDADWNQVAIMPAHPSGHGHDRFLAVGSFGGEILTAVFSRLGTEAVSIISLRRASKSEKTRLRWSRQQRR